MKRSGLLTVTSEVDLLGRLQPGARFPLFQSAMSFNQEMTHQNRLSYEALGIDVMHVRTPLISFENPNYIVGERSDVHEVQIQQKLLQQHVVSVLAQLCEGYSETLGSF